MLAAILALVPTSAVSANDATRDDARGDSEAGHPDIRRIEHGHGDEDRLRHTVVTYGDFETADAPCIMIEIRFPRDEQMKICGDGNVIRSRGNEKIGEVAVDRPTQSSVAYVFRPADIDGATTYRWFAFVRDAECPSNRCDRAPNNGWVDHFKIVTYEQWALGLLKQLDAPSCQNNKVAVVAWMANEGTEARYNPLATTYKLPGSTNFNSVGVQNYATLTQGNKGTRLTLERGWSIYGYKVIVKRLRACALPSRTARAIRASQWCSGCSGGEYVVWLVKPVRENYRTYAERLISTY